MDDSFLCLVRALVKTLVKYFKSKGGCSWAGSYWEFLTKQKNAFAVNYNQVFRMGAEILLQTWENALNFIVRELKYMHMDILKVLTK